MDNESEKCHAFLHSSGHSMTQLPNTAMRLAKYDCAYVMAEISLSLYYCMTAILKIEMSV